MFDLSLRVCGGRDVFSMGEGYGYVKYGLTEIYLV